MLNGVAPILIFTIPPTLGIDLSKTLKGIPLIGSSLTNVGIPIPLYLDENLTGVYIESESKSIDIDTDITPKYIVTPGSTIQSTTFVNQSGINNLVTVNMIASRDSLFLSVLLSMIDIIFAQLVSVKYSITYLNQNTVIFGGLLHSFQTTGSSSDTLLKITMQIQKNNQNKTSSVLNQYYDPAKIPAAPTPGG